MKSQEEEMWQEKEMIEEDRSVIRGGRKTRER